MQKHAFTPPPLVRFPRGDEHPRPSSSNSNDHYSYQVEKAETPFISMTRNGSSFLALEFLAQQFFKMKIRVPGYREKKNILIYAATVTDNKSPHRGVLLIHQHLFPLISCLSFFTYQIFGLLVGQRIGSRSNRYCSNFLTVIFIFISIVLGSVKKGEN